MKTWKPLIFQSKEKTPENNVWVFCVKLVVVSAGFWPLCREHVILKLAELVVPDGHSSHKFSKNANNEFQASYMETFLSLLFATGPCCDATCTQELTKLSIEKWKKKIHSKRNGKCLNETVAFLTEILHRWTFTCKAALDLQVVSDIKGLKSAVKCGLEKLIIMLQNCFHRRSQNELFEIINHKIWWKSSY